MTVSKGSLRAKTDYLKAVSNSEYLADKYGGTPNQWKGVGAATLIGADIQDSYSKWANNTLTAQSIEARQESISARASISTASIFQKGAQVQAAQTTAFVKSGVKLEGSALNVLTETANNALEAAKIRQSEADFQSTQLEVRKRIAESKADLAPLEFLVNVGSSAAISSIS